MFVLEPGHTANVDTNAKLNVPAKALRAVRWWKKEPVDVMAELVVAGGLIRVFLAAEASPKIEELYTVMPELPPDVQFERAAAIADRYRPLKLYADGRLRFKTEVASLLGFTLAEQPTLFVQPFHNGFEVMSLDFRAERLAKTLEATSIGLHHQEAD